MDRPIILREGCYTDADLHQLKKEKPLWKIRDVYEKQLCELFEIMHPSLRGMHAYADEKKIFLRSRSQKEKGDWVYFPWSGVLTHMVNEEEYFCLRTNRNRNLITEEEQKKLSLATLAFVGLSVGSHIAIACAYSGIGLHFKLAEFDTLDTTNLNRVRGRLDQVGEPKIGVLAQQLYEINPYLQLEFFEKGLTENTLQPLLKASTPQIVFEIIDNFEMKIRLRLACRESKVPVLMFANLGDSILVDIERYDLDEKLPLFNGVIGDMPEEILKNPDVTDEMKHRYAVELVGRENVPQKAIASVGEIGKTLVGRPQLMSTVTISGGMGAFLAKQLLLKEEIKGGRRLIKFGDFI